MTDNRKKRSQHLLILCVENRRVFRGCDGIALSRLNVTVYTVSNASGEWVEDSEGAVKVVGWH